MPPARPLTNINSSAIPQRGHPFSAQQLTPRTPHSGSRTSRLEQGFSKIPLSESNDGDYDDHGTLQSAPLLASSSTARFSVRSARERESAAAKSFGKRTFVYPTEFVSKALDRLPLAFGIFMGGVLLILIVLSLTRPEALHKYIGAKAPATSSTTVPSTTADSASATASILPEHSVHTQIDAHILSYENYTKFPLTGLEYRQECAKIFNGYMAHGDYWDKSMMAPSDVLHADDMAVCSSTIVYMLDGTAGLTADLALMAQAAALARERNRTFLVDDTHWDRGKWVDHFVDVRLLQPGPEPGCKAPPPQELVACPRTARHWVITARTAKYHFGHAFSNHYENAYGRNLNRLKPIFDTAFESFKNTIVPNAKSKELIQLAREELSKFLKDGSIESPYVGTHIRRGDSKSMSYSYADRKVPLEEYLEAIKATWTRLHTGESSHTLPTVYLATDSPDAQHEFYQAYQGRVFSLYGSKNPTLRAHASPQEYRQSQFDSLDLQARISATRGMVVDLALVSGIWTSQSDLKPDATVCALSSTVCRLAPIGLGWDRAFGHVGSDFGELDERNKHWIEVDQKSSVVPVWRAFLLFN